MATLTGDLRECSSHDHVPCPFRANGTRATGSRDTSAASVRQIDISMGGQSSSTFCSPVVSSAASASADLAPSRDADAPSEKQPSHVALSPSGSNGSLPPPMYVPCSSPKCFNILLSSLASPRCMLCLDGTVPCAIAKCARRVDATIDRVCAYCRKCQCSECLKAFDAGELNSAHVAAKLHEVGYKGTCCSRHRPATERVQAGLKRKARTQVSRMLTQFKRLRIRKKER